MNVCDSFDLDKKDSIKVDQITEFISIYIYIYILLLLTTRRDSQVCVCVCIRASNTHTSVNSPKVFNFVSERTTRTERKKDKIIQQKRPRQVDELFLMVRLERHGNQSH